MNDATLSAATINESLGATVAEMRRRLGLSLCEVCEKAQRAGHRLSPSVLSRLERGQRGFTSAQAAAVSAALGLRLTWTIEQVA